MQLIIRCDWCGKEFERKKASVHDRNYCCRKCLGQANAERFRAKRFRACDNCGRQFEYRGRHKKRNAHFFCCDECYKEYKTKKIYVNCDWCGKPIYKKRSDVARNKHNFCDPSCYIDYINFEKAGAPNQIVCGTPLHRSLAKMKLGRALKENEEVHHIDGNHNNNDLENLMVLTASEHAKIHAAQKERDTSGRFIKKR